MRGLRGFLRQELRDELLPFGHPRQLGGHVVNGNLEPRQPHLDVAGALIRSFFNRTNFVT